MAGFCKHCGAALNPGARFCKGCGAAVEAPPAVPAPPQTERAGYSPVANTPEFRQLAATKKSEDTKFFKVLLIITCVVAVSLFICIWLFIDLIFLNLFFTACVLSVALTYAIVLINRINRKKSPPLEVTVWRYFTTNPDFSGFKEGDNSGNMLYLVKFKDGAGRTIRTTNIHDGRYQEYYQIGDRCLFHPDIDFFEKYDKSRDTFSLCPFCKGKVELGHTRCTRCKKPLLV